MTNTWCEHEKRRRYTWKVPEDVGRYQLDHIKQKCRNSVTDARTMPGADANTDHTLVIMRER